MVDLVIHPRTMALINIDMQNIFVEGYPISAPNGLQLLNRINHLTNVCRKHGVLVIHVAHKLRADDSNMGVLADVVPTIRSERLLSDGEKSADLHEKLDIQRTDVILTKPRIDAFVGTDLELILRKNRIENVMVSGVSTSVCCDTTARHGALLDFNVIMLRDGTGTGGLAGFTADQVQQFTCDHFASNFGWVATVGEMMSRIESVGGDS